MKLALYFFVLCISIWGFRLREIKTVSGAADSSEAIIERLGISGPLQFNHTSFNLSWSDKPNETYYVQEYLPKGENVDHFNQLLTVNLFNKPVSTEDAARQKVAELNDRKQTDPICNYAVIKSKDGKEYMIDFLLSEGTGEKEIAEFNVYHYKQIEIADKKAALLVYAYSQRSYGNAVPGFLTSLKSERPAILQAMSAAQTPGITISNK